MDGSPLRAPFNNPVDGDAPMKQWSGARIPANAPPAFADDGTMLPIHLMTVSSSTQSHGLVILNTGSFIANGASLEKMVAKVYGVTRHWISAPDPLPMPKEWRSACRSQMRPKRSWTDIFAEPPMFRQESQTTGVSRSGGEWWSSP